MTETLKKEFRLFYYYLELSHHPFRRIYNYFSWFFEIFFENRYALVIGRGNAIYSRTLQDRKLNEKDKTPISIEIK